MLRFAFFVVLCLGLAPALLPRPSVNAECVIYRDLHRAGTASHAVFHGRVVGTRPADPPMEHWDWTRLEVDRVFKGVVLPVIVVRQPRAEDYFRFRTGQTYVVFMAKDASTGACVNFQTTGLSDAQALFGPGSAPLPLALPVLPLSWRPLDGVR